MQEELQNSVDYITKKVGAKTGFDIPKNYFENIEDNFSLHLSEEKLPKQHNLSIPENYFENLEDSILKKVTPTKTATKVISLQQKIVRFTSIASAACILLFIGIHYFSNDIVTIDSLADTEIESWLENNTSNFSNSDYIIAFEETDFNDDELLSTDIEDDILEEYLNSIEENTILNELN